MSNCVSDKYCAEWLRQHAATQARLRSDSRKVNPGDVFVAVKGENADGLSFAGVAASRSACAMLCEPREDIAICASGLPFLEVPDLHQRLGNIAALFYGEPTTDLLGVAVTGTNGKTSTSHWCGALLTALGMNCAVIGTNGVFFNERKLTSEGLTTPDAASLQALFKDLKKFGARAFAMEASSIGLVRGRMNGTRITTALFTNLTRDHLDYHKTFKAYEEAKVMLFDWPGLENAVINIDDEAGVRFAVRTMKRRVRTLTYSVEGRILEGCETLQAQAIEYTPQGMCFEIVFAGKKATVHTHLFGLFNVSNLLAAAGTALCAGFDLKSVAETISTLRAPEGRLEAFTAHEMPLAVVDYAHTPDALQKVLVAMRETAQRRCGELVCIFGAGGGRDKGKRPMMGEVASRLADRTVITNDNPRFEDPQEIAREIEAGILPQKRGKSETLPDRRAAIVESICRANENDVLVIAGKGHEDYQEVRGVKHHFSDAECVREAFNERFVRIRKNGHHEREQ